MSAGAFKDIEKLEDDLWEAADNLRANSKLSSNAYFLPVLGVIFLRHAANRFEAAQRQIEADQASGKMPKRILDRLCEALPRPPFTETETEEIAARVYNHVWQQSAAAGIRPQS